MTAIFSDVRDISISGGNITMVQGNQNLARDGSKGIERLYDHVAPGAFHNSSERYDPPKCHPGTRELIIREIMDWIKTVDKDHFFLWLYGPAGAGKSAIAQTIAELCHEAGLLAASFFFSRTAPSRNNPTLLIPTLSYQLTISIPEIADHISLAIERDPLIFNRSLEAQFSGLILKPLSKLPSQKDLPRLIIIDGLDECNNAQNSHRSILSTLSFYLQQKHPSVPFIFLITSRPEQDIRSIFNQERMNSITLRLVLDDHYQPDQDIRNFLISKFKEIKANHPLASHLTPSWPSVSEVDNLVRKSSGQFIYASTVIKFVKSPRHRPTDRLDVVFGQKTPGKQVPFAELDALYWLIFSSAEDIGPVLEVFAFLLLFANVNSHQQTHTPYVVENFLGYQSGDLQIILADLHSVISVPSPSQNHTLAKLRIFHASLGDYLLDKSRSGVYFIDAPNAHARMAGICIQHMIPILGRGRKLRNTWKNSYLDIACENLMMECVNAYPTKELLHQLSSLKFDQILLFLASKGNSWNAIMVILPAFIRWIQQQCPTSHTEGCLCRCYMVYFDNLLLRKLSDLAPSDPAIQCMLTIFTLNSYHKNAYVSASTVCESVKDPDTENHLRQLLAYPMHQDLLEYRTMARDFFTDRARSKRYYRDKSNYMELAVILLHYLSHIRFPAIYSLDYDSWTAVQEILSRFPREPQLVTFLRTYQVRDNFMQRQNLLKVIEAYIKEYDLTNMEASPSGLEPLSPSAASLPKA